MAIKFSFFAYGILAISALALVLSFSSAATGQNDWANNFFGLGSLIAFAFLAYMFIKLLKNGGRR